MLAKQSDVILNMLIWNLVPEHEDKLNASCFQNRQVVNLLLLQLRQDKALDIIIESILRKLEFRGSKFERVSFDANCNKQVQESRFLLPVSFSIRLVLPHESVEVIVDQALDVLPKPGR